MLLIDRAPTINICIFHFVPFFIKHFFVSRHAIGNFAENRNDIFVDKTATRAERDQCSLGCRWPDGGGRRSKAAHQPLFFLFTFHGRARSRFSF